VNLSKKKKTRKKGGVIHNLKRPGAKVTLARGDRERCGDGGKKDEGGAKPWVGGRAGVQFPVLEIRGDRIMEVKQNNRTCGNYEILHQRRVKGRERRPTKARLMGGFNHEIIQRGVQKKKKGVKNKVQGPLKGRRKAVKEPSKRSDQRSRSRWGVDGASFVQMTKNGKGVVS